MTGNVHHESLCMQGPLSAIAYADLCSERIWHGGKLPIHVQFRKRGESFCGRVVEVKAGRSGLDWFRLDAGAGPLWVNHFNVRACASNGVCMCEFDSAAEAAPASASAAAALPLSPSVTRGQQS